MGGDEAVGLGARPQLGEGEALAREVLLRSVCVDDTLDRVEDVEVADAARVERRAPPARSPR